MIFNTKKRYFKKKLDGVQKMLWDLEFKRFKTLEIREEIRQSYDEDLDRLDGIKKKIKDTEKNMEKGELARLDDEKVRIEKNVEKKKQQMDSLDLEVSGAKPSQQYPEGVQGINDQIDALRELYEMLKVYIKEL